MTSQQPDPAVTAKIEALAALIQKQAREYLATRCSQWQADRENTYIVPGKIYTKIDRGTRPSKGFLMVENATGCIFGIKGYGRVHKGHFYGTLDTIDGYFWGDSAYGPDKLPRR